MSNITLRSNAKEIADIIIRERGSEFMAGWSGSTHKFKSEGKAETVYCNDGRGFVQGVAVESTEFGTMFYLGPFRIDTMPTSKRMFNFKCAGSLLVRSNEMGPPPRGSE